MEEDELKVDAKTLEKNKEVVRNFFKRMEEGDMRKVKGLLSSDFKLHIPGLTNPVNSDELIQMIKDYYKAFPDNIHELYEMVAEGNMVAVRIVEYGTHRGEYESVPATGKRIKLAAIHMGTIEDGKIREWWLTEDSLGLMHQIGMVLKPK